MRLTAFTDYCLRVLIYLAVQTQRRATIGEIARGYGISEHHLTKVVHFLGKEGFLLNVRGHGGGLSLARPAADIRVSVVVRAAEGMPLPATCFDADAPRCALGAACRLKSVLASATEAFYATLARYTIADLAAEPEWRIISSMALSNPAAAASGARAGEPPAKGAT